MFGWLKKLLGKEEIELPPDTPTVPKKRRLRKAKRTKRIRRPIQKQERKEEQDIMSITGEIKEALAELQVAKDKALAKVEALELQVSSLIGQGEKPAEPPATDAPKKRGGRPPGAKNKKNIQVAAVQDPGDGEDRCPNCGNLVPECLCQRVQSATKSIFKD